MHLRYTGEKKAWLWKRKGGEESGTNDVDNNDSRTLSIQTISLYHHESSILAIVAAVKSKGTNATISDK